MLTPGNPEPQLGTRATAAAPEHPTPAVPPGYKQTEVGVIPVDWEVAIANDLCTKIQDGTHFSPKIGGSDFMYITSRNIRHGFLDIDLAERIDAAQHRAIYKRCDVKTGDVLLTKDGVNTGNAALNTLEEEISLLSSIAFLRFDPDLHNAAFFLQVLLSEDGQRQIQEQMAGNAITRLTLEKIRKLKFAFPPTLAEQTAIAEALSDADALIAGLEQAIAKQRLLKQGAMQELLTGKRRLPGFEGEWVVKALGELFRLHYGRSQRGIAVDGGAFPILATGGEVARTDKFIYDRPSVVIGRKGTIDLPQYIDTPFWAIDTTYYCEFFGDSEPKYIYYVLMTLDWYSYNEASGVPSLSAKTVEAIELRLPQSAEQTAIAAVLSDMDAAIAALEAKLAKARLVKQGMMGELLTGKKRLGIGD